MKVQYGYLWLAFTILVWAAVLMGCATSTKEGQMTFGVSKVETCERMITHPNGDTEKFNCQILESEGISGELAGALSILFRWWPF